MTATIYETVTAMIAPALFLTATGSLMISTATRIARIVDRIRALVAMCDRSTRGDEVLDFPEERRKHAIEELRPLQRRSDRAIAAVTLLYTAFGSFAATSMAIAIDSMTGHRFLGGAYALCVRRGRSAALEQHSRMPYHWSCAAQRVNFLSSCALVRRHRLAVHDVPCDEGRR